MKKACIAILSISFLALIILLIVRATSFQIALNNSGFHSTDVYTIEHSFDSNKNEFKIIQTVTKDDKLSLINLYRNQFGFWKISDANTTESNDPGFISIGWIQSSGAKRFLPAENAQFEKEWHMVYSGNNALKLIEFKSGQIPANVTISIQQAGALYWLHLITFAEPDILNSIDVKALLQENHCIP